MGAQEHERLLLVAQQIRLDQLAADCSGLLRAAAVPHAVIKGVTTARWLYDPPRPYRDVDLLVPYTALPQAITALAPIADDRTAHFGEEASHSQVLNAHGSGAEIDVHATLPATSVDHRDPDAPWRVLGAHLVDLDLDGRIVPALDRPGRCLVLALHVIAGGRDSPQVREDLRRARAAVDAAEWAESRLRAETLGLTGHFDAAISYVSGGDVSRAPREVRLRLAGAPAPAIRLAALARGPKRAAARALARELWPSGEFMRRYDPGHASSARARAAARLRRLIGLVRLLLGSRAGRVRSRR